MTLNLTVNEGSSPAAPITLGTFNVRAHYNETDAGQLFGPFSTKEAAEQCILILAGRQGVVKVELEVV